MKSLSEYIKINEGIFDAKDVTYKDFAQANELLEIFNIDNSNIQDKSELVKLFFNTDLKLADGTSVKDSVNNNKAEFKKYNLAGYVQGTHTNDLEKLISNKYGKLDVEVGDDTYSDKNGKALLRVLKLDNGKEQPMVLAEFK